MQRLHSLPNSISLSIECPTDANANAPALPVHLRLAKVRMDHWQAPATVLASSDSEGLGIRALLGKPNDVDGSESRFFLYVTALKDASTGSAGEVSQQHVVHEQVRFCAATLRIGCRAKPSRQGSGLYRRVSKRMQVGPMCQYVTRPKTASLNEIQG